MAFRKHFVKQKLYDTCSFNNSKARNGNMKDDQVKGDTIKLDNHVTEIFYAL